MPPKSSSTPGRKKKEKKPKIFHLEIVLSEGIDEEHGGEETTVDVSVSSLYTLRQVHRVISSVLVIPVATQESMHYYHHSSTVPLNLDEALESLLVTTGGETDIQLLVTSKSDSSRKKKQKLKHDATDTDAIYYNTNHLLPTASLKSRSLDDNDESEDLVVTCYTRIFETEGEPIRRLRVLLKRNQTCKNLMKDVSVLWDRQNLKFRYGRSVLSEEKTFEELGFENGAEILVTGARGT